MVHKTYGEIFANGVLDVVGDESHPDRLNLLLWTEGKFRIEPNFSVDVESKFGPKTGARKITYEAEGLHPSFARAIRFPVRPAPFGSSRKLLDDLCEAIKRFTGLENSHVSMAAHHARASWFPEATECPAALVISGALCPQGQRLFQVMSCVCRHSLTLAETNSASLRSLPWGFSPSVFLEHSDVNADLKKFIRTTRAGGYLPSRGKLIRTRCTSVICAEESPARLEWNAIEIPVTYTPVALPILDEDVQQKLASEFQPKLFQYRLLHISKILKSTFDVAPLTSSVSALARSLARCVVDDAATRAEIVRQFTQRDEEAKNEISADARAAVVGALHSLCHNATKVSVHAAEIANVAAPILKERGEVVVPSARRVGDLLRDLDFNPRRLDSRGRGLILNAQVRKHIHRLAWNYGILSHDNADPHCVDCVEFEKARNKGVERDTAEPK